MYSWSENLPKLMILRDEADTLLQRILKCTKKKQQNYQQH